MSVEAELEESIGYTPVQRMRHSAAHVMAEAVLEIFPDAKLAIGPAIVSIMISICLALLHQKIYQTSSSVWHVSSLGSILSYVIVGPVKRL